MEINEIIRDLVSKGMNKDDIITTLNQMGVENAETLVSQALEAVEKPKEVQAPVNIVSQVNTPDYSELKTKLDILIDLNKQILESQRQLLFKLK
ncbi:Uncharacterised protein [uncultured archaeon]|nr:Uncharacterised protein [uncultured archaeon]